MIPIPNNFNASVNESRAIRGVSTHDALNTVCLNHEKITHGAVSSSGEYVVEEGVECVNVMATCIPHADFYGTDEGNTFSDWQKKNVLDGMRFDVAADTATINAESSIGDIEGFLDRNAVFEMAFRIFNSLFSDPSVGTPNYDYRIIKNKEKLGGLLKLRNPKLEASNVVNKSIYLNGSVNSFWYDKRVTHVVQKILKADDQPNAGANNANAAPVQADVVELLQQQEQEMDLNVDKYERISGNKFK